MCFRVLTQLEGLYPKRKYFWPQVNSNWAQESSFEDHMVKSPLEALVVLRSNVRIRLLKFEFWILALGYTHVFFVFKFSWSKYMFHALVYIYMTLKFTNIEYHV